MQPIITLTILTSTFDEFSRQAKIAETFLPYIQIDVMDGVFVPSHSFPERQEINDLNLRLKYELHLMVADPIAEMKTWAGVKNVTRVIFPITSKNPQACIDFAKKQGWQVGIFLNPDIPLSAGEPYFDQIDLVLFMTVHPGRQGAPFVPEVLEKIREFTKLKKRPLCAVDGAVNLETIVQLRHAGVEIFNVGSYFTKAPDMKIAYQKLAETLK